MKQTRSKVKYTLKKRLKPDNNQVSTCTSMQNFWFNYNDCTTTHFGLNPEAVKNINFRINLYALVLQLCTEKYTIDVFVI